MNLPIHMSIETVPCTSPAALRYALAPALNNPTYNLPFQSPLVTSSITYHAIGLCTISIEIYACHHMSQPLLDLPTINITDIINDLVVVETHHLIFTNLLRLQIITSCNFKAAIYGQYV